MHLKGTMSWNYDNLEKELYHIDDIIFTPEKFIRFTDFDDENSYAVMANCVEKDRYIYISDDKILAYDGFLSKDDNKHYWHGRFSESGRKGSFVLAW